MRISTSPALRDSALSVLDQAVCSLSNFLTGVIIARALLPEAFGVYSLYFTGILLLAGFQNALITGPARVLGVRPSGVDTGGYFGAQVRLQLMLSAVLVTGAQELIQAAQPFEQTAKAGLVMIHSEIRSGGRE